MARFFLAVVCFLCVAFCAPGALLRKRDNKKCKFHPSADIACDWCQKNADKMAGFPCTCQVGDCTKEMSDASGDCGSATDGMPQGPYYCAVCAPTMIPTTESDEYPDGVIRTTDYAEEAGWTDVHPCR